MKAFFCLYFVAVLYTALAVNPKEKLREFSDACKPESGVSDEALTKARNGENQDDPKLKEHANCILKKAGFLDASGQLQIETIRTKFNEASPGKSESIEKFIKKCAVQKASPQETASNFFICLHDVREAAAAH